MISSYGFLLHGLLALQSVFRLGRLGLQHEECSDHLVHIIRCDEEGRRGSPAGPKIIKQKKSENQKTIAWHDHNETAAAPNNHLQIL